MESTAFIKPWKILVVDDDYDVQAVTSMVLRDFEYMGRHIELIKAMSAKEGFELAKMHNDIAVALIDVVMETELSGLELVKNIRYELGNKAMRIILRTGQPGVAPEKEVVLKYDINDYKEKTELTYQKLETSIITALRSYSDIFDNICLKTEIEATQRELILILGEAIDMRSLETGAHVTRISKLCCMLALKYGLSEEESNKLSLIAPMHDVGKISIPDSILNKPGKLTTEEFEAMKTHTTNGYKLLSKSNRSLLRDAAIIALQHHEKYDGTGYPKGLKGDQIHIYARIVALLDVFDALITERVYKVAWTFEETMDYIIEQKGKHFDPVLVDILVNSYKDILQIEEVTTILIK